MDARSPYEGFLVRGDERPEVYYVQGGKKRLVDAGVFAQHGMRLDGVIVTPDTEDMEDGPPVTPLERPNVSVIGDQIVLRLRPVPFGPQNISLVEGEVETAREKDVTTRGNGDVIAEEGIVVLTSHRLLVFGSEKKPAQAMALGLGHIQSVESESKFMARYSKILVHMIGAHGQILRLSFHSRGQAAFLEHMQTSLRMRLWKTTKPKKKDPEQFTAMSAGIGGIMRAAQKEASDRDETLQAAFADMSSLMTKARELVDLAQRFRTAQAKEKGEEGEDSTRNLFLSIGIAQPVTRGSAKKSGTSFHVSLARELSTFLKPLMDRHDGVLSLTDVYCFYNRARGADLVSPDDVFQACDLLPTLVPPPPHMMRLRKFDSGVIVLLSDAHSEDAVTARLAAYATEEVPNGGISAADVAKAHHVSVVLAKEQLLAAEQRGALCRDYSGQGLRFFPNFFLDASTIRL